MRRSSGRTRSAVACAVIVTAAGWLNAFSAGAQTQTQLFCRWGEPAKMAPVPKCGIPRELEVKVPPNTWKLYFLRSENPGLSGYFHQSRTPGAQPKLFHRKVNLVNVVLLLCPSDFKSERVLAFQRLNNQRRLTGRPTCRLGPPSGKTAEPRAGTKPPEPARKVPEPRASAGAPEPGAGDSGEGKGKGAASGSVYDAAAASSAAGSGSKAAWKKIDRLARLLGLTALAVALCCLVALAVLFRYFSRKLRRMAQDE